ncbi:AT-rich interactive domain-containing protein 5A-like isoform X3 [Oncorhynchus nerka]|uniref:AT-rich interactive domain-containing protein 5A-like isoform X3 n=1 Tax=Oncorhynchus nerka TaxID=8023 RepID=UPI0011306FEE|nr:AT-rich interactive domain-containing protein 5A-like isoform X1 [Oncorhynchus nerka]
MGHTPFFAYVFDPEGGRDTSQRPVMEEGRGVEGTLNQNSAAMEIADSASECEEPPRSSPMETEERSFIANLHCFMKDRGTPIERIPHLGFKQINLWKIYKTVEKLGSYDSVTARRLWKNVYDELGGSPGSTSAATCTRRHYERLVLPFERQLRGEEDKPLPPSKPRKQYKRSPEGSKSEGKRKRPHLEKETDSEGQLHSTPSSPWTTPAERLHPDRPPPNNETTVSDDLSSSAYSLSQPGQVQSSASDIISPLEKKKRMAQASLSQSQDCQSPRQEDRKGRPSVIHCSQSPGLVRSSRTRTTSEGSPLPPSSSSSRSPSPYSISSEDCPALTEERPPIPKPEVPFPFSSNPISACSGVPKPQSCSPDVKKYVVFPGGQRDFPQVSPLPGDTVSIKGQSKNSVWSPVCNGSNRRPAHQISPPTSCTYTVRSCLVPSTSSFTKVYPKSMEPLRPIPFRPGYTFHQNPNRPMLHDNDLIYTKKLHMVPRHYQTEKKEKSTAMLPKQQPVFHSNVSIPVSYLVPAYDRTRGDSGQKPPVHPFFLSTNRLPQSQINPMYRHAPTGHTHASPYEPALYSYPYSIPMLNPHTGYSITGVHYPQTRQ